MEQVVIQYNNIKESQMNLCQYYVNFKIIFLLAPAKYALCQLCLHGLWHLKVVQIFAL